jgi:hypothetical protein
MEEEDAEAVVMNFALMILVVGVMSLALDEEMKMSKAEMVMTMNDDPQQLVCEHFLNSINLSIRLAVGDGLYRPAIIIALLNAAAEVIIGSYVPQDVKKVTNESVKTLRERVSYWQSKAEKQKPDNATLQ